MNEHDPMERLRAADPAADVEPRPGFAEETVARASEGRTARDGGTTNDTGSPRPAVVLAAERSRRRRRTRLVAAIAASAAVIAVIAGAAGYGLADTIRSGSSVLADGAEGQHADAGAAPPVSLPGPGQFGVTEGGGAFDEQGEAGSRELNADGYGDGYSNPSHSDFRASALLSASEGTAAAYAYDAPAASTAENVAALASALGVEGTPEVRDGAWNVGPQDGTAPSLWVSLDGTLSFSSFHPGRDPWLCDENDCTPTGEAPGEEAAIGALRDLIAATGRDPASFEYASEVWDDYPTRTATARPVVDGQQLDQGWGLELGPDGVISVYGALAELTPLGDYPVVSEREAFERLSDPRFSTDLMGWPLVDGGAEAYEEEEWVPPTEPPAVPRAGAPVSWPVRDVEIVSARLGIASHWQQDGSVSVVPTYEFTDAAGGIWPVIAVAESSLDVAVR
jgi:hypothetical protein